jgi:peroxiredoxin
MDEILREVQNTLVPCLNASSMLLSESVYQDSGVPSSYCIAEVPDFQSLLPQSQKYGVPVFGLTDGEIEKTGTVLQQLIEKRRFFNEQFDHFAEIIEQIKVNASL